MRMLAVTQDALGGPEVLKVTEVDRPVPGPTEVLVRVEAAGVNPTDWKSRARGGFLGEPPFTLGYDVSGVGGDSRTGQARYAPGDEVVGMLRCPYGSGASAQCGAAPARHFARKPSQVDHVHAAAVPLAGLTAWQALVDVAGLRGGQRVLVHAAAGGVGHLAVQIAKARGAYVIGTASAPKHNLLHDLGVDEAIDYRAEEFEKVIEPQVDLVLDLIGGEVATRSLDVLHPEGRLICLPS